MKRKLLMLLIITVLLLGCSGEAGAATFRDIDDAETAAAVDTLHALGLVDGVSSSRYDPDGLLTRAQFCKLLTLALGLDGDVSLYSHATRYADVTAAHWATGYVNLASAKGYINGYGDGSFGPEDSVTYGQAVTILLRALGYTTAQIGYYWPEDYVSFAAGVGLDADLELSAGSYLSRGDAALILLEFINTDKVNTGNANGGSSSYLDGLASQSISDVILLDADAVSANGKKHCAVCYVSGKAVYYEQEEEIDEDYVGYSGTLYLNEEGEVSSFAPDEQEYEVRQGLLLDNNDGGNAVIYSKRLRSYRLAGSYTSASAGSWGYLLINGSDQAAAFVTGYGQDAAALKMAEATEDEFYYTAARAYAVSSSALVLYKDDDLGWQAEEWSNAWEELSPGQATVYFDDDEIEWIVFTGSN